jgi:hypothetical protein
MVSCAVALSLVLTSATRAHADPTEAPATEMRSPAMVGIGVTMIIVSVPSGSYAAFGLGLGTKYGGGGVGQGAFELWTAGSALTLVTGIVLTAFGATQVTTDTWQTGVRLSPNGLIGRF